MELSEMIKVMQHYAKGGDVEFKEKNEDDRKWRLSRPDWNWDSFDYRIVEEKQKVIIEKWLCEYKNSDNLRGSKKFFIIEKAVPFEVVGKKVKLIESYEVEL